MPTTINRKRKGPIGQATDAVGGVGDYLDSQLGRVIGMNPRRMELGEVTQYTGTMRGGAVTISRRTLEQIRKEEKRHGGEIIDVVDSTGKHVTYVLVVRRGQNPAKFDRCVREVEAKGGDVNAYAVCTAAGTRGNPLVGSSGPGGGPGTWNILDKNGNIVSWNRDGKMAKYHAQQIGGRAVKVAPVARAVAETKHVIKMPDGSFIPMTKAGIETARKAWKEAERKGNPEDSAAAMYESFHGSPSQEFTEFTTEEHYHENLAELGVLAGLVVETEYAGTVALAFSGYHWDKREGAFDLEEGRQNPLWGDLFGTKTTTYHAKGGTTTTAKGMTYKGHPIIKQMAGQFKGEYNVPSIDRDSMFDNVKDAKSFIDGWADYKTKNPNRLGKELEGISDPYSAGAHLARQLTQSHIRPSRDTFLKYFKAWKKVHGGGDGALKSFEDGARSVWGKNPREFNPDPIASTTTLLASNEKGTQLYLVGGDQSLDLSALKIDGPEADHESIPIGDISIVTYHTSKVFYGKREEYDYWHRLSEESQGPLPILIYDRLNERLYISGGCYHIPQPWAETSPGITD